MQLHPSLSEGDIGYPWIYPLSMDIMPVHLLIKLMLGTVLQVPQEEDSSAPRHLVVKTALSEERANKNLSSPLSSAANARGMSFHILQHQNPHVPRSSMLKMPHSTYFKICLCTLTSSYRHLANSYTLLLNDNTTYTVCWPGVESSYTSLCLSFGNSLYVILQRWLNTNRYARIYQSTEHFKCV